MASDLGFDLPVTGNSVDLVVSQERLFCVVRKGAQMYDDVRSIKIFEVILASKECIECTEISSELLEWVLGDDLSTAAAGCDIAGVMEFYDGPVVAIGCASSILFCSCSGRSMAYNLVEKRWYKYPDNDKILEARDYFLGFHQEFYCRNYCLSLNVL